MMLDSDNHWIKNSKGEIINENREIVIGNHVWICSKCILLKGCSIGDNCVVKCHSLVCKDYSKIRNSIIKSEKIIENISWGNNEN
jgi:acetyltransferase-like isoleucine patch superfamily enzyme